MTIDILNKYRANSDWCSLINRLDGQLFALKKVEMDLIDIEDYECPVCGGTTKREDAICPFCRSALPVREEKGAWRKVYPSEQLLTLASEAWTTFSEIFRIQQAIDLECDAVTEEEKIRKQAAQLRQGILELMLGTTTDELILSARNYDTFVADYLLGVVEERYKIPFEARYKSKLTSADVTEAMESISKIREEKNL